jgi:uncharacterized protein (DUF2164 family)
MQVSYRILNRRLILSIGKYDANTLLQYVLKKIMQAPYYINQSINRSANQKSLVTSIWK